MALPSSFVALQTVADALNSSALSINFNAGGGPSATGTEFFATSLWMQSTDTPSFTPHSTTAAYGSAPWDSGTGGTSNWDEWDDSGYDAGGFASSSDAPGVLTNPTLSVTASGITWADNASSLSWTGLSDNAANGVYGALITHYISSAANRPVCFLNFGAEFPSSSGAFTIQWPSSGIWFLPAATTG